MRLMLFSGGRSSGMMAMQYHNQADEIVFTNTGREMPETLDFVRDVGEAIGRRIRWLEFCPLHKVREVDYDTASRQGEPFDDLLAMKGGFLPNQRFRFCTEYLKIRPVQALFGKDVTKMIGLRADEQHRKRDALYPLIDAGIGKQDVMRFWADQDFDLRITPGWGNCDGCFLKAEAQVAALARDFPDRHAWWEGHEGPGRTWSKRYSRAELRSFIERQGEFAFEDGVLCQSNGGECHPE